VSRQGEAAEPQVWRAGSKVGRTIYIHRGDDEKGLLVGLMDTPDLAALVVNAVNAWNAQAKAQEER
jgi:hypothetical protein